MFSPKAGIVESIIDVIKEYKEARGLIVRSFHCAKMIMNIYFVAR